MINYHPNTDEGFLKLI